MLAGFQLVVPIAIISSIFIIFLLEAASAYNSVDHGKFFRTCFVRKA